MQQKLNKMFMAIKKIRLGIPPFTTARSPVMCPQGRHDSGQVGSLDYLIRQNGPFQFSQVIALSNEAHIAIVGAESGAQRHRAALVSGVPDIQPRDLRLPRASLRGENHAPFGMFIGIAAAVLAAADLRARVALPAETAHSTPNPAQSAPSPAIPVTAGVAEIKDVPVVPHRTGNRAGL